MTSISSDKTHAQSQACGWVDDGWMGCITLGQGYPNSKIDTSGLQPFQR